MVFDRWDSCFLFNGQEVMYVSKIGKEDLRQYEGKAVQLDVTDFRQSMNPGPMMIKRYRLLGSAPYMASNSDLETLPEGLVLSVDGPFDSHGFPVFNVEVRNEGHQSVEVVSSRMIFALLSKKERDWALDPSDDLTVAVFDGNWLSVGGSLKESWSKGKIKVSYSYVAEPRNPLSGSLDLAPGQSRRTGLIFKVPSGEYQFLCGYEGNIHEGKCLVSKMIPFDVPFMPERGKVK